MAETDNTKTIRPRSPMSTTHFLLSQPVWFWVTSIIYQTVLVLISLKILSSEIKRRKETNTSFTIPSLKTYSILCMTTAMAMLLFALLEYIPFICTFGAALSYASGAATMLFMGFYQLSRLFYCFSNEQVHSDKGYPKWLFIIMGIAGIFLSINFVVGIFVTYQVLNQRCLYNESYEYVRIPVTMPEIDWAGPYAIVSGVTFIAWDIITFSLYISKIYSSTKPDRLIDRVTQRIRSNFTHDSMTACCV